MQCCAFSQGQKFQPSILPAARPDSTRYSKFGLSSGATPVIPTLDITGGAPELNPNFEYLVESAADHGRHVMDRCNLTVIFEPGKDYLLEFFKRHRVELVCSLPCYSAENVDRDRGKGTFELSIRTLQIFNELGY